MDRYSEVAPFLSRAGPESMKPVIRLVCILNNQGWETDADCTFDHNFRHMHIESLIFAQFFPVLTALCIIG